MRWRVSAWTHPATPAGSGGFALIDHSVPILGGSFSDPEEPRGRCSFTVAADYPWQDLITADPVTPANNRNALIRLYRDGVDNTGDPDQEFYLERYQRRVADDGADIIVLHGRAWKLAGLDAAVVRWWDWAAGKTRTLWPDWVYGGDDILTNTDFEGGAGDSETQTITISLTNPQHTHLVSAINASQTSFAVDTGSIFQTGDFLIIDLERMAITNVSGDTLTVTRGHAGTTAASHSAGTNNVHKVPGGTFTVSFGGQTTTALPFNPHGTPANHTDSADLKAALEALSTITEVTVTEVTTTATNPSPDHPGINSADKVFLRTVYTIEFGDPVGDVAALTVADSIVDAAMTVATTEPGQPGDVNGWTVATHVISGRQIGTYDSPPLRASDTSFGEPADSLRVDPASFAAGAQQTREASPGAPLSASVEIQPGVTGDYYLSLRDAATNLHLADSGYVTLTGGIFSTLTAAVPNGIPETTTEVTFRVQIVDPDASAYLPFFIRNPTLKEGLAPATIGKISADLIADAQTDHAPLVRLPWVNEGAYTLLDDSAGQAWVRSEHLILRRGKHYGRDIYGGQFYELGYLHDLTPNGATAIWDLEIWNPGNQGITHLDLGFILAVGVDGGVVAGRIPKQTRMLGEGADGIITETNDAGQEASFGVWESWFGDPDITDTSTLAAKAQQQLNDDLANNVAINVTLDPGAPVPYQSFARGDTASFLAGGYFDRHNRRITDITLVASTADNGDLDWTPTVTASKLLTGERAVKEGLYKLLTAYKRLPEGEGAGRGLLGEEEDDDTGAYIHLIRASTQTIPVGGDVIQWTGYASFPPYEFAEQIFPAVAPEIPKPGYYGARIEARWADYDHGGRLIVIRESEGIDEQVWPPAADDGAFQSGYGHEFVDTVEAIQCKIGDSIRVELDHEDPSNSHDLAFASLTLALVDRSRESESWEFVWPADNNWGIAWTGSRWWTTKSLSSANPALFERSGDGTILNSYAGFDNGSPPVNSGLVDDGTDLWGVGNNDSDSLVKLDKTDGSIIARYTTSGVTSGYLGLAFNGTNLFAVETVRDRVEEYTLAGAAGSTHPFPSGFELRGLAWAGSHWWASTLTGEIIRLDTGFNVTHRIPGPPSTGSQYASIEGSGHVGGCHYRDGYLYVMTFQGLYRRAV